MTPEEAARMLRDDPESFKLELLKGLISFDEKNIRPVYKWKLWPYPHRVQIGMQVGEGDNRIIFD